MNSMFWCRLALLALSAPGASAVLAADPPAPTQLPEVEKVDERKQGVGEEAGSVEMVCRNVRITGSRKREQVCHTKAEWAAMRRNATEAVRTTQQRPTGNLEGGGG